MVLDLSEALYKQETIVQGVNCLKVDLLILDYCDETAFFALYYLYLLDAKRLCETVAYEAFRTWRWSCCTHDGRRGPSETSTEGLCHLVTQ